MGRNPILFAGALGPELIKAGGGERAAIGGQRERCHFVGGAGVRMSHFGIDKFPATDRLVRPAGDHDVAVENELHTSDGPFVTDQALQ